MKMTITIEESDVREYITDMLLKNGLKPRDLDYIFDPKRKVYVIECDPVPIPLEEACVVPETDVHPRTPITSDPPKDETEDAMSLAQLRSASANLAARGPAPARGVHPAAQAHAKLAAVRVPMDGESDEPPFGGK